MIASRSCPVTLCALALVLACTACGGLTPSGSGTAGGGGVKGLGADPAVVTTVPPSPAECIAPATTAAAAPQATPAPQAQAVLSQRCASCHATQAPRFTDTASAAPSGASILASVEGGQMPPSGPLADAEIAALKAWSDAGFARALALADPAAPTYEGAIKGMMTAKCAWCHSANASPGDRQKPYLTTAAAVQSHVSDLLQEMTRGRMPPRGAKPALEATDVATVTAWKAAGFPAGTPAPTIDPAAGVFYASTISTLLATNCLGCHKSGGQVPDLSSYQRASAEAAKSLQAIEASTMPPSGSLRPDEIAGFKAWVDAGSPYDAAGTAPPAPAATSAAMPADPAPSTTEPAPAIPTQPKGCNLAP